MTKADSEQNTSAFFFLEKQKSLTEILGWRRCELGVGGAVGGAESFTAPTQEPGKMSISGSLATLQAASIDFTQQMDVLSDC